MVELELKLAFTDCNGPLVKDTSCCALCITPLTMLHLYLLQVLADVTEECNKHGTVLRAVIPRLQGTGPEAEVREKGCTKQYIELHAAFPIMMYFPCIYCRRWAAVVVVRCLCSSWMVRVPPRP